MILDDKKTHDRFINKAILDEYDWMVKKFIEKWIPEEVARAKAISMQRDKYNKLK